MNFKVSFCQEQKTPPDGCTHIRINTIKQVHDWVKVELGVYYLFGMGQWLVDDWATKNINVVSIIKIPNGDTDAS
tara:strand:- start:206 stop:430 length:225 start_codon:yes stop_codon:yes gene_type:complete